MIRPLPLFAIAAAMLLVIAAPTRAADVSLSPRWTPGEEVVFTYTSDSIRRDSLPAIQSTKEQRTRQDMTFRRKVIETGPAGTTLELVFDRIKVVVTQGRMFMAYDSQKPPEPDRSNVLEDAAAPMLGVPLTVKLNAENEVTSISGFPEPRTVDGAIRPLIVDDELIRNSIASMYGMQKKPASAKVGDRWIMDETLPNEPGTVLAIRHHRTLQSADEKSAVIVTNGTADIRPVTPGARSKRLLGEFDLTSTHHWDRTNGRIGWMVMEQRTLMHGEFKQARTDHITIVRLTLAAEGFTPPEPPKPAPGPALAPTATP